MIFDVHPCNSRFCFRLECCQRQFGHRQQLPAISGRGRHLLLRDGERETLWPGSCTRPKNRDLRRTTRKRFVAISGRTVKAGLDAMIPSDLVHRLAACHICSVRYDCWCDRMLVFGRRRRTWTGILVYPIRLTHLVFEVLQSLVELLDGTIAEAVEPYQILNIIDRFGGCFAIVWNSHPVLLDRFEISTLISSNPQNRQRVLYHYSSLKFTDN